MMKVFAVTGATGFIGRNLVKSLADEGRKVSVLIRDGRKRNLLDSLNICIREGNVLDKESLKKFIDGSTDIIHLASIISSSKKDDYFKVNIEGMKNLVEVSETLGITKFIYVSTIDVEASPDSLYGSTKMEAERILEKSKLNYIILRPAVIYGKYDNKNITTMIKVAQSFFFFPMIGDGSYKRQPLFVDDLIWVIKRILDCNSCLSKKYNIGGPNSLSLNEMVKIIFKVIKKHKTIIHFPVSAANIFFKSCVFLNTNLSANLEQVKSIAKDKFFDISLIKEELAFNPIDFERGLRLMLDGQAE